MLIFWDQRLVFLATPKAGSTAIEAALEPLASVAITRPAALKHTGIATWRAHVAPWLGAEDRREFTTVALMREPIDWLRSWYRFRQRDDQDDPVHAMAGITFADFARDYAALGGPDRLGIGRQSDVLTQDGARIDRIFRYEDMPAFVDFLEERLDCVVELPRLNVPPSVDVALSDDQAAVLTKAMDADVTLYRSLG
ncbi:sulfotransferase family protein [Paracoccus sp. TK19116]|uniref:Sulfotransferase family protein n=1 Tax=Paracoccus albicereus TaxID=2922394 RepID=A0ABT1MXK8_9RHOB|nr:sulfotransferase family protein [Paracoccus albicereus]MCQ0971611.1 sulfotransferase family protein [Paracoccus albicereus]